jgi:hypothetical protein
MTKSSMRLMSADLLGDRRALVLLLLLCCVSCGSPGPSKHDPRASWTALEGYEYLIVARCFALGGVGPAGQTSTGEFAFQSVLRSPNASDVFRLILSPGSHSTEEGKLYALCGIRAKQRSAFDNLASTVASTNAEVITQSGCVVMHERAADVVSRIRAGSYDFHIANN